MSKSIIYKVSIYDSKESLQDNRMIGYQTQQGTPTYGNLEQLKTDVRQMVKEAGLDCKNFRLYWKDNAGDKIRDAFKKRNRNVGHCPKRWEGVQTGSQIFDLVQMGHRGVGGRGS